MTWRLSVAPWWVRGTTRGVLSGVYFAAFQAVAHHLGRQALPWPAAVRTGLVIGALFGVGVGSASAWRERTRGPRPELAGLTRAQQREAARATARGPAPADPAARTAALSIVRLDLDAWRGRRAVTLGTCGALLAAGLVLALTAHDRVLVLSALLLAVALGGLATRGRRLERRLAVLGAA
ncbi:hypothetical protein GCM10027047_30880 [Rhodococcus aerolatus]